MCWSFKKTLQSENSSATFAITIQQEKKQQKTLHFMKRQEEFTKKQIIDSFPLLPTFGYVQFPFVEIKVAKVNVAGFSILFSFNLWPFFKGVSKTA